MTAAHHVTKFFALAAAGRQAALDINRTTGEVVCQYTHNKETGAEGLGTPGVPYGDQWQRAATAAGGVIQPAL